MIPVSLSATALEVGIECPARYYAEKFLKTPTPSGDAAMRGSVVHGALEQFVQKVVIDKTMAWEWEIMEVFLITSFKKIYGTSDIDSEAYADCKDMCERWMLSTDVRDVEVVNLEERREFELITSVGSIPFVFIIDRLDKLGEGIYRVVDYKSIRAFISAEELRHKLQPRVYALAVQIMHPDAKEIWVQFDMLRHDSDNPGTKFTVEDNATTWYMLIDEVEKLIALDETQALPENINNECMYCVRKSSCDTLLRHEAGGGIMAKSGDDAVRLLFEVTSREKALKYLKEELNNKIMAEASERDEFSWKVDNYEVKISARKSTKINQHGVAQVLGPDIFERYGKLGVTDLKDLIKSGELTEEQVAQIKSYIKEEYGDPSPKVTRKTVK